MQTNSLFAHFITSAMEFKECSDKGTDSVGVCLQKIPTGICDYEDIKPEFIFLGKNDSEIIC